MAFIILKIYFKKCLEIEIFFPIEIIIHEKTILRFT